MATGRSNKLVGQTGNKKWDSLHCAVTEPELAPHRDKWEVAERSLEA